MFHDVFQFHCSFSIIVTVWFIFGLLPSPSLTLIVSWIIQVGHCWPGVLTSVFLQVCPLEWEVYFRIMYVNICSFFVQTVLFQSISICLLFICFQYLCLVYFVMTYSILPFWCLWCNIRTSESPMLSVITHSDIKRWGVVALSWDIVLHVL